MRYFDLLERFEQSGCAVCNLTQRDVDRYLDALLYEYVNKVPTHQAIRAGRGLCNPHTWQLLNTRKGNVISISILYRAVLDEAEEIERKHASKLGFSRLFNRQSLADDLEPVEMCMACDKQNESEAMYIHMVAEHFHEVHVQELYRNSEGLCLPHIRLLLRAMKSAELTKAFLKMQREHWSRLHAHLDSFIHKFIEDDDHEAVWQRAMRLLAGHKDMFRLRR